MRLVRKTYSTASDIVADTATAGGALYVGDKIRRAVLDKEAAKLGQTLYDKDGKLIMKVLPKGAKGKALAAGALVAVPLAVGVAKIRGNKKDKEKK